jgi:hypothetical protein
MPKIRARADEHVSTCMKLYKRCSSSLSVPEIMELSGFSEGEQNCHVKRAWIYCCIKSLGLFHDKGKTHPVPVDVADEDGTVSSVTSASLNLSLAKIIPKKVIPTRNTSEAKQTKRVEALKKKQGYKIAFKHASSVYMREKAKKCGMSVFSISRMFKKVLNVNLSARIIQQLLKFGKIGTLPIRCGPKGNISERHFVTFSLPLKAL